MTYRKNGRRGAYALGLFLGSARSPVDAGRSGSEGVGGLGGDEADFDAAVQGGDAFQHRQGVPVVVAVFQAENRQRHAGLLLCLFLFCFPIQLMRHGISCRCVYNEASCGTAEEQFDGTNTRSAKRPKRKNFRDSR